MTCVILPSNLLVYHFLLSRGVLNYSKRNKRKQLFFSTFEPSFHLPAIWITESQRERAESLGYTVVDPPSIIATHLTEIIRLHLSELLTRQDVQNLINNIKENNQALVDELIPKIMGLGEI